jgi:hypothetical protein
MHSSNSKIPSKKSRQTALRGGISFRRCNAAADVDVDPFDTISAVFAMTTIPKKENGRRRFNVQPS